LKRIKKEFVEEHYGTDKIDEERADADSEADQTGTDRT